MWVIGGRADMGFVRDAWSSPDGVNWTLEADDLPFVPFAPGVVAFQDRIWVFRTDGIWSSPDGAAWTLETSEPDYGPRSGYVVTEWQNQLWMIGGSVDSQLVAEVWSSEDGVAWSLVTDEAAFGPIGSDIVTVFNGRLFLLSRTAGYWSTADGVEWELELEPSAAPSGGATLGVAVHEGSLYLIRGGDEVHAVDVLPPSGDWGAMERRGASHLRVRESFSVVSFEDRIWTIGGRSTGWFSLPPSYYNSIHSTFDATEWASGRISPERFTPRAEHASTVFGNRMWVIGGYDGEPRNDVWSSSDGDEWVEEHFRAPFAPRHGHQALAFDGKLWVVGGVDDEGAFQDVWSSADGRNWTEETSDGGFDGRLYGAVAQDGRMWVFGRRAWHSEDGATWTAGGHLGGGVLDREFAAAASHDGKLWVTGGSASQPNPPFYRLFQDVLRSEDGETFATVSTESLNKRNHTMVSHAGRLWAVSGQEVVSTIDGITWRNEPPAPAFPARHSHTSVVFLDRMWVIGGTSEQIAPSGELPDPGTLRSDVWSSSNGRAWSESSLLEVHHPPATLSFRSAELALTLRNSGHGQIHWSATVEEGSDWMSLSAGDGTLAAGESKALQLWIARNNEPTPRTGSILIEAPGAADSPVSIPFNQAAAPAIPPEGKFAPREGHTAEVFQGRMWVLGGNSADGPIGDVWSSDNGEQWLEEAPAAFPARGGHGSAVLNNRLWIAGGGAAEGVQFNDVWSSVDGVTWTEVTTSAPFSPRVGHAMLAFDGRLWVIGGRHGTSERLADVWSSADGVEWVLETADAGFAPRHRHAATVFDGRIWVLGGDAGDLPFARDVWSSANGVDWQEEPSSTVFGGRAGHGAAVLGERLMVTAGANGPVIPFPQWNDVWSSEDGHLWEQVAVSAPFARRSRHASVAFDGRLWVIGGLRDDSRYGVTYFNDVWSSSDGAAWQRNLPLMPDRPDWISYPNHSETGTYPVEWARSEHADAYAVQRSRDGGAWETVYTGPDTSFGEGAGYGQYRYRVQACSTGVCSSWMEGSGDITVLFNFRDYIEFYYLASLGRNAEGGAIATWHAGYFEYYIADGSIGVYLMPQDIGRIIFLSGEYEDRGRTCEEFISDLYLALLFRDASPDELAIWCTEPVAWNRAEAMSIVARSAEAMENVEMLFPNHLGEPVRNFVAAMYAGILDRLPEQGGLAAWTDTFEGAGPAGIEGAARFMAGTLFDSPEYEGKLPDDPHEAAAKTVVHLYRTFLNRYPMTQEIAYWSEELMTGRQSLDEVLDYFAASEEFAGRVQALQEAMDG